MEYPHEYSAAGAALSRVNARRSRMASSSMLRSSLVPESKVEYGDEHGDYEARMQKSQERNTSTSTSFVHDKRSSDSARKQRQRSISFVQDMETSRRDAKLALSRFRANSPRIALDKEYASSYTSLAKNQQSSDASSSKLTLIKARRQHSYASQTAAALAQRPAHTTAAPRKASSSYSGFSSRASEARRDWSDSDDDDSSDASDSDTMEVESKFEDSRRPESKYTKKAKRELLVKNARSNNNNNVDDDNGNNNSNNNNNNNNDTKNDSKSSKRRSSSSSNGSKPSSVTCDKCDAKGHVADGCPWFRKSRDKHPDAQPGKKRSLGEGDGKVVYRKNARVVTMPGDGSCLFHSLSYGLGGAVNAHMLRRQIAAFVQANPRLDIADTPLEDWVRWDSAKSVVAYTRRMAVGGWGGGIECAACSRLMNVNVHIYERQRGTGASYKRISCFDLPEPKERKHARTINVLYCGGVHYNALVLP